jgi:hypothetical protein
LNVKTQDRQAGSSDREQLSGVKVYKIGDEAEKGADMVGKTSGGQWAGLKTGRVD